MAANDNIWTSTSYGYAAGVILFPKRYSQLTTAFRFEIHDMQVGQVFAFKMTVAGAGYPSRVLPQCNVLAWYPRVKIHRDAVAYAGLISYAGDPLREGGGGTPFYHLELNSAPGVGATPGMVIFEVRPVADADNPISNPDDPTFTHYKENLRIYIEGSLFTPNENCEVLVPVTGLVRVYPTSTLDPGPAGDLDSCWP